MPANAKENANAPKNTPQVANVSLSANAKAPANVQKNTPNLANAEMLANAKETANAPKPTPTADEFRRPVVKNRNLYDPHATPATQLSGGASGSTGGAPSAPPAVIMESSMSELTISEGEDSFLISNRGIKPQPTTLLFDYTSAGSVSSPSPSPSPVEASAHKKKETNILEIRNLQRGYPHEMRLRLEPLRATGAKIINRNGALLAMFPTAKEAFAVLYSPTFAAYGLHPYFPHM